MYVPNSYLKNKSKNKYLNGVLSNSNIDMNTYVDLKQQLAETVSKNEEK